MKISYKGTNYRGWQAQADHRNDCLPTVQGTIAESLRKISKFEECSVTGTSRTDAGVHASGQIGKLSVPRLIEPAKLQQGLNSLLPEDIRIKDCELCEESFNPKECSLRKEYHYYFSTSEVQAPSMADIVAHVAGPLDMDLLRRATQVFVGERDFYNFYKRNSQTSSTVRTIYKCELANRVYSPLIEELYCLKISGNGFLKHMVRYMVATIFEVARGNISIDTIEQYLSEHFEDKLCIKAKAKGLHLELIETR